MTLFQLKEYVNTSNSALWNIRKWGAERFEEMSWNNLPSRIKNAEVFKAMPIRIYCGSVKEWNAILK